MSFRLSRWLSYAALSIPFLLLGFYLWRFTVNAPYYDDFLWGLEFISKMQDSASFLEKLKHIFSFHNEHRIIWAHTIIYSQFLFSSQLDFKILTLIGNLPLFIVPFMFWKAISAYSSRVILFLIILILLWQPQCYHNIFTNYGLTNHYVILFILLIIFLLIYCPKYLIFTLLLACICTFISGAGFLGWVLGASVLFFKNRKSAFLIWIVLGLVMTLLYFFAFLSDTPKNLTTPLSSWSAWLVNILFYLPAFCFDLVEFGQFGSSVTRILATSLGMTFFGFVAFIIIKKRHQILTNPISQMRSLSDNHLFLVHVLGWIVIVGFLASIKRTSGTFMAWAIPDHYRIYSQLFVIAVFILCLPFLTGRALLWILTGCFIFFGASYYINTPRVVNLSNQLRADAHNYANVGHWVLFPSYIGEDYYLRADSISIKAVNKNIWKPQRWSDSEVSKLIVVATKDTIFDKNWQNIDIQYNNIPSTPFVIGQTKVQKQLLLPVQVKFASPFYALKNWTITQPLPKSATNRWFWKHFLERKK